ncbi:hypothetical protein PVL29_012014 [Vitis rotundifolia]|uniref:Uncharacterized protein n=1 Tax=Vitis rotundifolia TaxID=103349 RepID=A0AA38ZQV2_VITRO|nr:hypothetical protein PVL29_012014 [Vitis rotundifolia]
MVSGRVPKRRSYSSEYRGIGDRRRIKSLRVLENKRKKVSYPGHYRRRDTIRGSIGEYQIDRESNPCEYRRIQDRNDGIQASEESNPCEYRRIKERKHPIWATTEEEILSERVSENTRQTRNRIRASTGESKTKMMVSGRLSEKRSYSGEYRRIEMMIPRQLPEKRSYSGKYRRVTNRQGINPSEFCRIQDRKDGIRASTREEIIFGRVPGNRRHTKNRIRTSTGE